MSTPDSISPGQSDPTDEENQPGLSGIDGSVVEVAKVEKKIEIIQAPSLAALVRFEELSWPEDERATPEDLQRRLDAFPEGIFMLMADGEPQAQITISPKDIHDPDTIDSFEKMRDMAVDRESPVLWVTNMASNMESKGKGYVSGLMSHVMTWAEESGYQSIMAGVTCDNFTDLKASGDVASIDDYMSKRLNPGVNTFRSAAKKYEQKTGYKAFVWNSDPIKDYWPADKASDGYGVMVEVDLPGKDYGQHPITPPIAVLERTSRGHIIERYRAYSHAGSAIGEGIAATVYDVWYVHRNDSISTLRQLSNTLADEYSRTWDKIEKLPYDADEQTDKSLRDKAVTSLFCFEIVQSIVESRSRAEIESQELTRVPDIEYSIDLDEVNVLGVQDRQTASGKERTMSLLVPPRGCKMKCDFCSPSHIANPNFPLTAEATEKVAIEVNNELRKNGGADVIKLFNAGNILWGSEFGQESGALHEHFWEVLPEILADSGLKAVEIEVRLDEFTDGGNSDNPVSTNSRREIVRNRLVKLKSELEKVGISLRVILAIEYNADLAGEQKGTINKGTENSIKAISFLDQHNIEWLGYAMLGGRLKDKTIDRADGIKSAVETVEFGFQNGAREMIVNCQYLDPINRFEEERDQIPYYVPTKQDILEVLSRLAHKLNNSYRLRITVDKEEIIKGTLGAEDYDPAMDSEFMSFVEKFNNAPHQSAFYRLSKYHFLNQPDSGHWGEDFYDGIEREDNSDQEGIDVLFLDLPFHSDPRLRDSSFSDFGKRQEIPRGVLSVATHLNRRGIKSRVVPTDAFVNQEYKTYDLDLHPEQIDQNTFVNFLLKNIDEQIERYKPKAIGISYMFSPSKESMFEVVRYIKERYGIPVILGGNAATLEKRDHQDSGLEEEMLSPFSGADAIVNFEGESAMMGIMKKLKDADFNIKEVDLSEVGNLTYRDRQTNKIINTPEIPRELTLGRGEEDYDPDHAGGLDYNLLARFGGMDLRDFNNYALFSRGCHGCCEFCTSPQFWKGVVSPMGLTSFEDEVHQVADAISSYSKKIDRSNDSDQMKNEGKEIGLLDDDIFLALDTYNGEYVTPEEKKILVEAGKGDEIKRTTVFEVIKPVLDRVKAEYPDLEFMIQTRYGHFRDEVSTEQHDNVSELEQRYAKMRSNNLIVDQPKLLKMVKESGVERVYLGMETADQSTLDEIKKMSFVNWLIPACQKIKEAGLTVGMFWIIGLPGSTVEGEEKSLEMINFLIEHDLIDEFEAHIFVPLPGSKGAQSKLIEKTIKSSEVSYISGKPTHICLDREGHETLNGSQMEDYWKESKELTEILKAKKKSQNVR